MFDGFARQWTPVLPVGEVTTKPQRVRIAGTDLVVWRPEPRARPGVLVDRCPHRGVSLALGQLADDGALTCSFHGWEFGTDGRCLHVPFNPDAPRHRLGAAALPVCESGGFVWVYTGFDDAESHLPNHHESLDDTSLTRHDHWEEWDCHWTRAMENMLDFPHLPYIHRTTIGRFVSRKMHRHSRLSLTVTDTAYGFALESRVDEHPPSAALRWYRPHGMVLDTMPEGETKVMRLHVFCVPVDAGRTRMFLTSQRNFAGNAAASLGINRFNLTVLHQDRAVVESSMPPEVPAGAAERSVPSDKPTLTFRTWYLRELAESTIPERR